MDDVTLQTWIEKAKSRLQSGGTLDDVLADLRSDGGNQIDTIKVLRGATGMDLKTAKQTVHFSPAWADQKMHQERFWDELNLRSFAGAALLVISTISLAGAGSAQAEMICPKIAGMIAGPFVPSADIAVKIYKAVAEARFRDRIQKYPTLAVDDLGQRWSVSGAASANGEQQSPEIKSSPGQIIVSAGGGQLSMEINKCDGAITNAHLNR